MTITELQDALVYTCLIQQDAIEDPDGYDEGSTLAQIDELHKMLPSDDTALLRQALTVFRMLEDTPCGDKATMEAALRERLGETK